MQSEENYKMMCDSIAQGMCLMELVHDESGQIIDLVFQAQNAAFEGHTGLGNVVGKSVNQLPAGLGADWIDTYKRVSATGEELTSEEYIEDTGRWFNIRFSMIGDTGSKWGTITFADLTQHSNPEQSQLVAGQLGSEAIYQQQLILEFSDALRILADPADIQEKALKLVAEQLNVMRATYFEVDADQEHFKMTARYEKDAMPIPDHMRLSDFSEDLAENYRSGRTLFVDDTEKESQLESQREAYRAIDVRAWPSVPLVKNGELVAIVGVHSRTARKWKDAELKLLEEIAERTWSAVERAHAQEIMRGSEKRLRLATEAAEMATWEWDLVQNQVIWNDRHFWIFGMEPQEGPVKPEVFFNHVHSVDRERVGRLLQKALADDTEFDTEFRALRDDGAERWMSGYGRVVERKGTEPTLMSGVMLDVTSRHDTEKNLRLSEARQKAILESATDYAILTLDLDLNVHDWNAGAEFMLGYSEQEIMGQPGEIFFVPEDRAKGAPQFEKEKAMREGRAENERWHLRKDGSRFYGSGITSPLLDDSGNVIGLLKVMRDLTTAKQAEESLKLADQRKDQFLAMLAHELRNPISTVRNGLSVLKITHQEDREVAEIVGMMDNQAAHLVRMVDDLLDVSRVTQGKIQLKLERIDVGALVAAAVKAIMPQFESRQKTLHVPDSFPHLLIQGDATRISQVITNLLTNSMRYTGDQGQVSVSLTEENGEAVIRVKDDGIGLTAEQQTSIFGLFVQVDNSLARSQGGLGIGLTLVKQLVEMHGGRVEARSADLGKGSEFTVHLPLAGLADPGQTGGADPSARQSPPHILLIDDMEDLATLTAMLLRIRGYKVDIRNSGRAGAEAVELLKPTLVLCDIGMPELDGYQTARLIRQGDWGRHVSLYALSGYGQDEDKMRAMEAGFDGHLTKPVNMDELHILAKG